MCLIYAAGGPRHFEFARAERGEPAPEGATVFAACDGERVEDLLDDHVFATMTDAEYYEMRRLVEDLGRCEFIGCGCPYRTSGLQNLLRSLQSH